MVKCLYECLSLFIFFFLDNIFQNERADVSIVYAQVSQEKKKRGPPTNINISVRNIKAQIVNMSSNECAGFKSEYQVRFSILMLFSFCELYEIREFKLKHDLQSNRLL